MRSHTEEKIIYMISNEISIKIKAIPRKDRMPPLRGIALTNNIYSKKPSVYCTRKAFCVYDLWLGIHPHLPSISYGK